MERRTRFDDNTFYDVSAWTLPLAYNLPYATLARVPATEDAPAASRGLPPDATAPAWVVPWNQLEAPVVLAPGAPLLAGGAAHLFRMIRPAPFAALHQVAPGPNSRCPVPTQGSNPSRSAGMAVLTPMTGWW